MPSINKRRVLKSATVVIVCMLVLILLRLVIDQVQWYRTALRYLDSGDKKDAIMYFERVMNAHVPFSPFEEKAKRYLLEIASGFENEGKYELALLGYETVRSSRYLTRSFYLPDSEDIPFLNKKIAFIKAELLVKNGTESDLRSGYERQIQIMHKDYSPSVSWSIITIVSFWVYIITILAWILASQRGYLFASCLSFIMWIIALYIA